MSPQLWSNALGRCSYFFRPRRSRSAAAYKRSDFPVDDLSVRIYASVCPMHCGKTADRIRMPFGIVGQTGPDMRQVVRFGDRSTERVLLGRIWGAPHCNQWVLYGVRGDAQSSQILYVCRAREGGNTLPHSSPSQSLRRSSRYPRRLVCRSNSFFVPQRTSERTKFICQ